MTRFTDLGLSPRALKAVEELQYTDATPVQEQAIPLVFEGHDIIAAAKTGTGKTAAFSLPSMDKLPRKAKPKQPRMLIITPTRELATQIYEVCLTISHHTKHRVASVVGGVSITPQINRLKQGVDVLVATPGRLIDLMNQKAIDLSAVEILVLDEADRMLDMGFMPSVEHIVDQTPASRQTLLFSATVDKSIRKQVGSMLRDPQVVQVALKGETSDQVDQYIVKVPHTLKPALMVALLKERGHERVIAFARTKHRADTACRKLKQAGFKVEAIHSDRTQGQRRRALDNFANGKTDILVATDVLARGIDIPYVSYVVNYDLPGQAEDYVHRIGRTGRADARGFAVSFVSSENVNDLKAIQKFTKQTIPEITVKGFDLEEAAAEASRRANQIAAKKDPDIAEASKELAKRKKKKAQAQHRKAEENARKHPAKHGKSTKRSSAHESSGKPASNSVRKTSRSKSTTSDMRPGRAHRAALAEQRRNKKKRGR